MDLRRRFCVLAGAILTAVPAAGAEPALVVARSAWTNAIDEATRDIRTEYVTRAPGPTLFFWTLVEGTQADLQALRTAGELPIRHQWFRYRGRRVEFIDVVAPDSALRLVDNIPLFVGPRPEPIADIALLDGLQQEINRSGVFNWRTWSRKVHLSPGDWEVRVVLNTRRPLQCRRANGSMGACFRSITIE